MDLLKYYPGLYTDHYELTMAQGYFLNGKKDVPAAFDYFFRKSPFGGSYTVFAGLGDLLEMLENLMFSRDDIEFLEKSGFDERFLEYLENFRFSGTVYSVSEGEIVFANEPVLRVEGNIIEAQIIETLLLNIINFQSLIATKASRLKRAAGKKLVVDFGLRRAHDLGGLAASKAAFIGGADSTSNLLAAKMYGIPSSGTQAHSWIQCYENEKQAFLDFARTTKGKIILLVDTYDTLKSGIPNVIETARELEKEGIKVHGIRLDSGDLLELSKSARKMLDVNGLQHISIVASNKIDEHVIQYLFENHAPIDSFGVGTKLTTGQPDGALDGVYKLSMFDQQPRMKISDDPGKSTLPGRKEIYRCFNEQGFFLADLITPLGSEPGTKLYDQFIPGKGKEIEYFSKENISKKVMENGKSQFKTSVNEIANYVIKRLEQLPSYYKEFENSSSYPVGMNEEMKEVKTSIKNKLKNKMEENVAILSEQLDLSS